MRSLALPVAVCAASLAAQLGCTERPDHVGQIRRAFAAYRSALLSGDGDAATRLVDHATIEWYGDAIHDALQLGREDLDRLNLLRKYTVLRLRHEFSRDDLARMTGPDLFGYSVTNGWVSKASVQKAVLAGITVERERAHASIEGGPDVPLFHFVSEDGAWKVALWRIFPSANAALGAWVKESGLTEDDYFFRMIGATSKFRVDRSILDGPRTRAPSPRIEADTATSGEGDARETE